MYMENQDENDLDLFQEDWFDKGLPKEFILPNLSSPKHAPWFNPPTSPNAFSNSNTSYSSINHQTQQDQVLNLGSTTEPTLASDDPVPDEPVPEPGSKPDTSHEQSPSSSPVKKKPCLNHGDEIYICMICKRTFPSVHGLGGHRSSHTKARKKDQTIASFLKNKPNGDKNNSTTHVSSSPFSNDDDDDLSIVTEEKNKFPEEDCRTLNDFNLHVDHQECH